MWVSHTIGCDLIHVGSKLCDFIHYTKICGLSCGTYIMLKLQIDIS